MTSSFLNFGNVMWKTRIQKCIPLGTFSNKLLSTHLWMGFLPWEQELHCLILEKMEPLLTTHYFEVTLSIGIKILQVKIWTSYSALVYITCMSHTWGLKQNNILNPVSPNSDQHQFSPDNIYMLPIEMVMRVYKMITEGKMLWSVVKLSQPL